MTPRLLRHSLLGFAGLFAVASSAQGALLFADDFDHGQFQTINYNALANWTVTAGSVDAFTNGGFGLPCPSLGCLDMDGTTGAAGTIQTRTTFSLDPGDYVVNLNVAGNQRVNTPDSMEILLGGRRLGSISAGGFAAYGIANIPFSVAVLDSGPLILKHAGGDNFGLLLDRVELVSRGGGGEVPSPAPLTLLGLGLAGISFSRRRGPGSR